MANKLTPLQKIDEVLHNISVRNELEIVTNTEKIYQSLGEIYPDQIGIMELIIIIRKLKKDGYIEELIFDEVPHYYKTFDGSLFREQGGYYKRNELENSTLKMHKTTFFLTWILAIGTSVAALYYLSELLIKWFCCGH